jgi:predicted AAA+ superfamily ATPase
MFIVDELKCFNMEIRSSAELRDKPKIYFIDPAIACNVLKITEEKLLNDSLTNGFIFESLVYKELKIYSDITNSSIHYYRDSSGLEVDFIIEDFDGNCIAIEVKLGGEIGIKEGEKNLMKFKSLLNEEDLKKFKSFNIITAATNSYKTANGVNVFPISYLYLDVEKFFKE